MAWNDRKLSNIIGRERKYTLYTDPWGVVDFCDSHDNQCPWSATPPMEQLCFSFFGRPVNHFSSSFCPAQFFSIIFILFSHPFNPFLGWPSFFNYFYPFFSSFFCPFLGWPSFSIILFSSLILFFVRPGFPIIFFLSLIFLSSPIFQLFSPFLSSFFCPAQFWHGSHDKTPPQGLIQKIAPKRLNKKAAVHQKHLFAYTNSLFINIYSHIHITTSYLNIYSYI